MKSNLFSKHKLIFKMSLVAVFSALCFVVMLIPKIPVPSLVGTPYIHFGNLVVILVAIIFGGWVGGLSGAIGMGIYDIISGYGIWTLKTVVLKLGIGLVAGLVYKLVRNRNDNRLKYEMLGIGSLFLIFGLFTATLAVITSGKLVIGEMTISLSWILYVPPMILGVALILPAFPLKIIFSQKAMYAASISICFNIFGELAGGLLKKLLTGNGFRVSLAMTIVSIPATIINGFIAVIAVGLVFLPIEKAIKKIQGDDNIDNLEETEKQK